MQNAVKTWQCLALALVLSAAGLWLAPMAAAEQAPADNPCSGDVATFCKEVNPGGGRMIGCLKQHENELSPECKAQMKDGAKRFKEAHEACKDDVDALCQGIKPGGGRIIKCLKAHEEELSPECKEAFAKAKAKPRKNKNQ
jgi:hypothetical protein